MDHSQNLSNQSLQIYRTFIKENVTKTVQTLTRHYYVIIMIIAQSGSIKGRKLMIDIRHINHKGS